MNPVACIPPYESNIIETVWKNTKWFLQLRPPRISWPLRTKN